MATKTSRKSSSRKSSSRSRSRAGASSRSSGSKKKKEFFIASGTGRKFEKVSESRGVATLKQVEADVVTGGTGAFGGDHGEIQVPVERLQGERTTERGLAEADLWRPAS